MPRATQYTTSEVILIRHAQSQWNLENRFTGWADPGLTPAGVTEAIVAAQRLHEAGYRFDTAYSSVLLRARQTLDLILETIQQTEIPHYQDWRLNERHYGMLQGVDKSAAMREVGEQQVWRWRRGYSDKAAPLAKSDPRHPVHDPLYQHIARHRLPNVESLADTQQRVVEFWNEQIVQRIQSRQRILISSHGNTLRALLMHLGRMSVTEVERFEIPTATPIVCVFDRDANLIEWRYLNQHTKANIA